MRKYEKKKIKSYFFQSFEDERERRDGTHTHRLEYIIIVYTQCTSTRMATLFLLLLLYTLSYCTLKKKKKISIFYDESYILFIYIKHFANCGNISSSQVFFFISILFFFFFYHCMDFFLAKVIDT